MRTFFILIALILSVGMVSAQNSRVDNNVNTFCYHDNDTLTNAGTVTQTNSKDLPYPYNYQINIVSANISGTTAGTMHIENRAYGQSEWVRLDTLVIGGGLNYVPKTGSVLSGAVRCRTVGTGTQSSRVATDICVIRRGQ